MNHYFSIAGHKIPAELKNLYQEVSKTFEKKVMDSVKTTQEKKDEKNEKVFHKSNYSWGLFKKYWRQQA